MENRNQELFTIAEAFEKIGYLLKSINFTNNYMEVTPYALIIDKEDRHLFPFLSFTKIIKALDEIGYIFISSDNEKLNIISKKIMIKNNDIF